MHNNYQNILKCLDILSVALAVGLAMEDGTRRIGNFGGGDSSESAEESEDSEEGDEENEEEKEKENEIVEEKFLRQEREEGKEIEEEKAENEKMGLGLLSETRLTPEPEDEKMELLSERILSPEPEGGNVEFLSETKLTSEPREEKMEVLSEIKLIPEPDPSPTRNRPPRTVTYHHVFVSDSESESSDGNSKAAKSHPPRPARYHHVLLSDSESESSDGNSKAGKSHPPRPERYHHVLLSDSESEASNENMYSHDQAEILKTGKQMESEESVSDSEASDGNGKADKTDLDEEKESEGKVIAVDMKMKLKADIRSLIPDRAGYESNLRTMAMSKYYYDSLDRSKKASKKAENPLSSPKFDNTDYFLQAPEQLNEVCVLTVTSQNDHGGRLHSNSQRELEADGAGRDAQVHVAGTRTHNAPAPTPYEHQGLHSNTERELESAAAARDAHLPGSSSFSQNAASAPQSHPGKERLHSNTERELEAAAAAVDARIPLVGRYAPEPASPEPPQSRRRGSGLHSNTERELVAAASAREAGILFDGPFVRSAAPPQSGQRGSGLHSNTERELVAAASAREAGILFDGPFAQNPDAGPSRSGSSVIHSNTERELEAAAAGRDAGQSEPPLDNRAQRAARDEPQLRHGRKLSQKDLIGTSIAAALRMNPAHWMRMHNGFGSKSPRREEHVEAEQPQHRRERKHSQRELIGISYAAKSYQYTSYSTLNSNRAPSPSANSLYRPQQGRQQRKMSQNDLLGLAHAAVRERLFSDRAAERSNADQPSPLTNKNEFHAAGPSHGPRHPPPHDAGSGSSSSNGHGPAQQHSGTQMHAHLASSTGTQTSSHHAPPHHDSTSRDSPRDQHLGSQYRSDDDSSGSGHHRGADPRSTAQRDLNNARRYRPYEPQAHTGRSPNEEGDKLDSSRVQIHGHPPSGPSSSGLHAQCVGDPAPDPDPDPDDEDEEGSSDPIPDDDSDNFPRPPLDEDDYNPQPIPDDDSDNYPPLPPPDEGDYDPMPQDYTYNCPPVDQYFRHPPLPMLPFPPPPPPPSGDYTGPVQVGTSPSRIDQPYLRVRQPGDRLLLRRPRCGLNIVSAMRRDKSLPVDRRKDNRIPRTPGRVDINFSPRTGDIILRHVRLPGQGAVEIWYPGLQIQDGDSLIRFKLDPWSYDSNTRTSSNLIIVKAKGYISFERMWIYMGRAINSVTKAEQRVLGVGAMDGRTVYARPANHLEF